MTTPRRNLAVLGALALVVVAGCVSSMSQSGSSGGPSAPVPSLSFTEPSESAEPSQPNPPSTSDLTGTWEGTWAIDPPYETVVGTMAMDFIQSGSSISGPITFTGTDCEDGTVEGSVNGSSITFGVVASSQTIQYTGTVTGATMSGTWSAVSCSGNVPITGTWEATKR
ncbi:MAG TPA: hypothetical protein VIA02_07810 [Candidatus Limnocylindria bacterium]|jgi:hypothetical protein